MLSKILIANRGEIAARIAKTCSELGIRSVAVYSEPDAGGLHVRLADESICIGPAPAAESYLSIEKVIKAAVDSGADAVHPGYGFLAENAAFARAVVEAGLVFIGPPPDAIDVMGEKVAARNVAIKANVPVVPGSASEVTTPEELQAFGAEHGFPVAIKASYGGGGRGMRIVNEGDDYAAALQSAQRESLGSFGRSEVYLERYLAAARHVEVQLFADTHGNIVWLGDRDCSVQRRHQKLVEEAPAPGLSTQTRIEMGEAAVRLAETVGYVGAGTVEYLVDIADEKFYFLEMNTRIQVEHPVTEMVTGLDLIAEQIRVASGDTLTVLESGPAARGHAIEIRLNAENVAGGLFAPSPGVITSLVAPLAVGVRLDTGYLTGDEVQPFYDSMIAKLIAWAPTREHAIARLRSALGELQVVGVPTTAPAAEAILAHPDFAAGGVSTRWLEERVGLASLLPPEPDTPSDVANEAAADVLSRQEVEVGGQLYVIPYFSETPSMASAVVGASDPASAPSGGQPRREAGRRRTGPSAARSGRVTSPMQGTIIAVSVHAGEYVEAGHVLVVLEAMKMENPVRSTVAGIVTAISVAVGQVVPAGTELAVVEPASA
jgi:acetyl-CoA/propionyl-CoA carboxylase biotin carboxyl carrier protein